MDKYYKWDGTTQGVEGLELFLGQKVQFNPESGRVHFTLSDIQYEVNVGNTVIVLAEGDVLLIGDDQNVDAAIAQYRASGAVPNVPLNDAAPPLDDAPAYEEGTFEWALTQLGRGNAIRCTAWKPGRVITQDEAANGKWELA